MNAYYDPQMIKKAVFPKWYWLFLWLLPTYMSFSNDDNDSDVILWKKFRGHIYIVGEETL